MMKKPAAAWTVLAAVLIFGTVFGSWRSLTGQRKTVTEAFYRGVDDSGYGIATNLDLRVEYARNLCKIAGDYDAAAEIQEVEDACRELETEDEFDDKYEANQGLTAAVDALDRTLQRQNLSQEDEDYRKSLMADLASYEMRIDKLASSFNAQARNFNDHVLGGFPAKLFGALTDVEEVEEYA